MHSNIIPSPIPLEQNVTWVESICRWKIQMKDNDCQYSWEAKQGRGCHTGDRRGRHDMEQWGAVIQGQERGCHTGGRRGAVIQGTGEGLSYRESERAVLQGTGEGLSYRDRRGASYRLQERAVYGVQERGCHTGYRRGAVIQGTEEGLSYMDTGEGMSYWGLYTGQRGLLYRVLRGAVIQERDVYRYGEGLSFRYREGSYRVRRGCQVEASIRDWEGLSYRRAGLKVTGEGLQGRVGCSYSRGAFCKVEGLIQGKWGDVYRE